MTREELFEAWAPAGARWSAWAKPVLFASLPREVASAPAPGAAFGGVEPAIPPADGRTAIVVDLPAAEAVAWGVALARRGYRPVPLFNGNVGPTLAFLGRIPSAAVDPAPIVAALVGHAPAIAALGLGAAAPPAFLLDARRMSPDRAPRPGDFDNRWMVFPQDFPSARLLASHGIRAALAVQRSARAADDLAHALRRWQEGGIELSRWEAGSGESSVRMEVAAPPRYRSLWYRMLALLRLRRSLVGGFGSQIPQPGTGGAFG